MRLYHRTTASRAQEILRSGFRDGVGTYMTDREWRGVWLSEEPLDENEGACGDTLMAVDLNLTPQAIGEYEWIEEGKGYREFLIPAELVNAHGKATISVTPD